MNRLKKAAAALALAATLAVGFGSVAQAVTAAPAQAYTDRGWTYVWNCMPYPSAALRWRDYDWWEETFLGKRDQWVFSHYIYRYC